MDIQQLEVAGQDVALEVDEAADGGIVDQVDQALALNDIDVHGEVLLTDAVVVGQNLNNAVIVIQTDSVVITAGTLGDGGAVVNHRDVSAGLDMGIDQLIEVEVHGNVGVRQDDVALLLRLEPVQDAVQCVHTA